MDKLTPEQRSRLMSHVRSRNTKPERFVRSLLHRLGYRYRLHRTDLPGKPDLAFSARKRVVFVNGCFWHGHACPRGKLPATNREFWVTKISANKRRDRLVHRRLRTQGWHVLVIWECQTKDMTSLQSKLTLFLGPPRVIKSGRRVDDRT